MKTLNRLDSIQGGNPLIIAAIAMRTAEYFFDQWEKSRKEQHERIDRETKSYLLDQEISRYERLIALKSAYEEDSD